MKGIGSGEIKALNRSIAVNAGVSSAIMLSATLGGILFERVGFSESTVILVFLLGIILVSVRTLGFVYGIAASIYGVLAFNYFFTEPRYSLTVHDPQYLITFLVMLIVALITSTLTARVKSQVELSLLREARTTVLYQISQDLLMSKGIQEIYTVVIHQLKRLFGLPAFAYIPDHKGALIPVNAKGGGGDPSGENELLLAEQVFRTGTAMGCQQRPQAGLKGCYIPVVGQSRVLGVIGVARHDSEIMASEQVALLDAVAAQIALAVEREKILEAEQAARLEVDRERFRNTLLQSISHDLRTPLTGIAGAAATILDNYDQLDDVIKKRLLEGMGDDVQWLIRLVENLLSMTRLEAGMPNLRIRPEAVEEVVAEAVVQVRKRSPNHRILVDLPEELLMVPMDGNLIEQVLINLLDNAVKYTVADSEIHMRVYKDGRSVWFEVTDNGLGIPEKDLPHLFDLFYTGSNAAPEVRRGSGLGLTICQAVISAHHGEIFAFNRTEGGAGFRFRIPVSELEEDIYE